MATGMATRCPACATVFRVVPDQLRVSDGWVRCGRCAEVFNAGERLVDLETGAPQRMPDEREAATAAAAATASAAAAPPPPPQDATPGDFGPQAAADAAMDWAREQPAAQGVPAPAPTPEPALAPLSEHPPATEFASTDVAIDEPTQAPDPDEPPPDDADWRADARGGPAPVPSFMRRADRAARWRRPGVRAALGTLAALALLGLLAQVGHAYRDLIATRFAATRPALEQACAALGCSVGAARAIDSLAVDSSGLVRVEKSNVYKLSVALRNRAAIDVAVPTLDLALTDSQGKLLARRALRLAELGVSQTTIGAGRDLALQATLQAQFAPGNEVVAGYTIELFYP